MKRLTLMFAVLFFMLPSISLAAGLTSQQAASLITVVQSSPSTPANAFISLITSFSNITINQATSLIVVVQSAPGVPASAFVNLLTSFTVDTPTTSATNQTVAPVPTPQQPKTAVTCIASPILSLSIATTSTDYGQYDRFHATYSTGCPIQPGTPYSWSVQRGSAEDLANWRNGSKFDHSTIGRSNDNLQGTWETKWEAEKGDYILGSFFVLNNPVMPITFTMTVDGLTEQVTN
ncbi:hypothetical protein EXS57_03585 [Candidatus Kaiserbacteria bacterium]|nr:hypothetical protein [Candidatus Kaiserbacteria bacterium]